MNSTRTPHRKSLLLILLVAFLILGSVPINRLAKLNIVVASPEEKMFVDPPSIVDPDLTTGNYFTVDVNVSDVEDLYSWQVQIEWDPSILDLTTITFGDFLADQPGGTMTYKNVYQDLGLAGFGELSRGEIPGVDGSGWLATVEFLVEVDAGETVLDISGGDLKLTYYTKSTAPGTPVYTTIESGYFSNEAVEETGSIGGVVTDSDTGDPIAGASIVADGYSDTSAADGSYLISDVLVGEYTVSCSAAGYVSQDKAATVVKDTTTTVDFALETVPETFISVDPPVATANPGESFTINVNITDVEDLYSWTVEIGWQLGLLTVTDAEEGPFLKQGGSTFFTWNPHTSYVDLACTLSGVVPGVSGSGVLASVTFEVINAGNFTLDLHDTVLLDSSLAEISHQAFDGYFYTTYPVPQFTYSPNPLDNPGHPIEGEPITFDASTSYDPDGGVIDVYEWDFGDETSGSGQIVDHSYDSAGSYRVNLTVTDDEGETWSESLQILVLLHDISVEEVVVDPTEVVAGNPVEINATILNIGMVSETFNVTIYYDDTPIDTQTYMGLSPEENTTLTFIWDTSGVPPNEYTIKAYAYLVDAATLEARPDLETNMEDNTLVDGTVTITAPEMHDVAVTLVTAPAEAVQGDTVTIDVDVSNLGGFEETFDVEVTYDTTLIDSQSVTLASGDSTTVSFSWDTTGVTPDTYTLTAEAILATDEVPGNNIATTTIEIQPVPELGWIDGHVTDADTTLPIAGATVTADGYSATTDASGYYTIEVPAPATYDATAEMLGYISETVLDVFVDVGATVTVDFELTPTAPSDFSISASPTSLTIPQGESDTSTIMVTSLYDFSEPVDLMVSGVPSGVTATLTPTQVTPPPDGSESSTLTVQVDTMATPGVYTLTVTGTSGTLTHSVDITLEIVELPPETIDGLIDLVKEFFEQGEIDEQDIELGLLDKLYAARKQQERGGKTKTVGNILGAFINMAQAQRGKHISVEAADILIAYANSLIQNL